MKLVQILIKHEMRIISIICAVFIVFPVVFLGWLLAFSIFIKPAPKHFDFIQYSGHVVKAEIIDWTSSDYIHPLNSDNYRFIIPLDDSQIPDLLTSLSEVNYYKNGPGDPPGFGGRCFLFTLDDGSFRIVGRIGYAQYRLGDETLDRYTGLWDRIREDDFEDLFEPYLGR